MKAQFVINPLAPEVSRLPRQVRVFIRKTHFHPAKPATQRNPSSDQDVDFVANDTCHRVWPYTSTPSDPCGDGHQLRANTVDPDFDIDSSEEFADHDDPYAGLTIVEPGYGNIRRWLRGHDIL